MKIRTVILCCLFISTGFFTLRGNTQKALELQRAISKIAGTSSYSVIPITFSSDQLFEGSPVIRTIGTGFFIDAKGDFITAAHVIQFKQITQANGTKITGTLTAELRQNESGGIGAPFEIIEEDRDHDLALCHIKNFKVYLKSQNPMYKASKGKYYRPFASLAIRSAAPQIGQIILIDGFPLESSTPVIQLVLLSSTSTIFPQNSPVAGTVKDKYDLLELSVAANHGDSGGPVIDLATGEVVGVILQVVPAPLAVHGSQFYDANNYEMSGIILAAPAKWVQKLLIDHGIKSRLTPAGKFAD